MIKLDANQKLYFDKNGTQIMAGDKIKYANGVVCKVYSATDGTLGTDATNPKWIESGRAFECEYGIYPLTKEETEEVEVIKE